MDRLGFTGALMLSLIFLPLSRPNDQVLNCKEVRSSFQILHPGMKWAPENPVSGSDLQVCQTKGLTCCSRKMEERYLLSARHKMEAGLQAASSQLKLLIIQNAALFQEAFDMVLRLGRNSTSLLLREEFPALGSGANGAVTQLFQEASLYILGSDASVDHMVSSFFSRLFPLVHRRLLGNGPAAVATEDCLRGAWRSASAFGPYPKLMMTRLSRSLPATRGFLQALNLGIEVVNTTQHLRPGRECSRALLRLWYCPRCLGALEARPCPQLCPASMGTCLGGAAAVQPHWRAFVDGLGALAAALRGEQDLEAVVLRMHVVVRLALRHAVSAKTRITAQVSSVCTHTPQRVSRAAPPSGHTPGDLGPRNLQAMNFDPEETLSGHRREFISRLRAFSSFYGDLGESLCSHEPSSLNSSLCWNGLEMTDKLPGPGLKRPHPHGPEKQKSPEPVISQIIDKLKHINQLLRMVTVPERRWRARPGGGAVRRDPALASQGGDEEEEEEDLGSGDCDDEDDCTGVSGLGPPPRRKRLRIFAGWPGDGRQGSGFRPETPCRASQGTESRQAEQHQDLADNLAMDDLTLHELLLTPRLAPDSPAGPSLPGRAGCRCPPVTVLLVILPLAVLQLGLQ